MSRIKGKYVAQVIMEWDAQREPNMVSLAVIKDNAKHFPEGLKRLIEEDAIGAKVEVVEQYCDFVEVEE